MRIGELARELGVSPHAVRFYEKAGWLPQPGRAENGYREYEVADLDHLRLLVDLRRLDLPLDTAARLASWCHSGHCEQTSAALPDQLAERRAEYRGANRRAARAGCATGLARAAPGDWTAAVRRSAADAGG